MMWMRRGRQDFESILRESLSSVDLDKPGWGAAWKPLGVDPFPLKPLESATIDEWFVDREDDLKALYKFAMAAAKEPPARYGLVGPPEIGRTTLIAALRRGLELGRRELTEAIGREIRILTESAESVVSQPQEELESDEEPHTLFRFVDSIPQDVELLVVDDFHRYWRLLPQLSTIMAHRRPRVSILSVLTVSSWHRLASEEGFLESLTASRLLSPLSSGNTIDLLEARLHGMDLFERTALEGIARASGGVPGIAVRLARRSVVLAKQRSAEVVDADLVRQVISTTPNIELAEKIYQKLTRTEFDIAKSLLELDEGMTAVEVSDHWRIDRSTAVGHLTGMQDKGAVSGRRDGRRVRYSLDLGLRVKLELETMREGV